MLLGHRDSPKEPIGKSLVAINELNPRLELVSDQQQLKKMTNLYGLLRLRRLFWSLNHFIDVIMKVMLNKHVLSKVRVEIGKVKNKLK